MLDTIELTIYRQDDTGNPAFHARKIRFNRAEITQWWPENIGTSIRTTCGAHTVVAEDYATVTALLTTAPPPASGYGKYLSEISDPRD